MRQNLLFIIIVLLSGCRTSEATNDHLLNSVADDVASESIVLSNELRTKDGHSFVHLSNGVTSYDLQGPEAGEPVVLVHGVSGPMAVWDKTAPALAAQGYRVLRYDLFGRGYSDRLDATYDQDLFDKQLVELLDKLGITQPVLLVGSSMGGVIVAEFRNRHPERVKKLALLDPAGFPMKTPPIAKVMNVPLVGETIFAIKGDKLLKARNRSYFFRPDDVPEMIAAYEDQLVFKGTRKAMLSTWRNMPLQSFDKGYAAVSTSRVPVLLIRGREDQAIPFANADAASKALEGSELVAVENAGHLPQIEAPAAVNAALTAFFNDAATASPPAEDGRCSDPASWGAKLPCTQSLGKPLTAIEPALLENLEQFKSPFYQRFTLRHADQPLTLPGGIVKDYFFPTLYGDVTSAVALFFCSYDQAKALMPTPDLKPVYMGLGRSVVVLTSYRYNKVYGIGPYNEVAVAIPVVVEHTNVPLLPLLLSDFKGLGFYVVSMPVTTLENQTRGKRLWGLPKVVQEIDLGVLGDDYVTTVLDDAGQSYLEFRVPMTGDKTTVDQQMALYSQLNGATVRSTSHSRGDVAQTTWKKTFAVRNKEPEKAFLKLGTSPAAALLRGLKIEPQPFQVRFAARLESTFDLPEATVGAKP